MLNVKKRERKLKSGAIALYFDYVLDGKRYQENSGLHLQPGKDATTKANNKEVLVRFDYLLAKKQTELLDGIVTPALAKRNRANFIDCYKDFMLLYPSRERRYTSVLNKLIAFHGSETLPVSLISENWLGKFYAYLQQHLTGETPYDYFKALTRVLRYATKQKLFSTCPADSFKLKRENNAPKDVLTIAELKALQHARCPNETVKRAFLFSAATGLRYCDVKGLKWGDVKDNCISIIQSKTRKPVNVPLNADAVLLLGAQRNASDLIFPLPTANGCNYSIRAWVKNAGIDKDITYHCARHTAGTNLHLYGVDVIAIASILGHTTIKHTQRYVRTSAAHLKQAVNKIPAFYCD